MYIRAFIDFKAMQITNQEGIRSGSETIWSLLTRCVEEAGLVAGEVNPLFAVQGRVGQSSDFIPAGVHIVDLSYVRLVHRGAGYLAVFHTVVLYYCP